MTISVLVGTYRGRKHIDCCLDSLYRYVAGFDMVTFIDDSQDEEHREWLAQHGKVVAVEEPGGFARALFTACGAAEGRDCFWLEEDFEFVAPVSLREMQQILLDRPYLAQLALQRQPVYDYEKQAGSLLGGLEAVGVHCDWVDGIWEQNRLFTTNPSLWPGWVWRDGWPVTQHSDYRKRDRLRSRGCRFGYLPEVRVIHHGDHEGHGY